MITAPQFPILVLKTDVAQRCDSLLVMSYKNWSAHDFLKREGANSHMKYGGLLAVLIFILLLNLHDADIYAVLSVQPREPTADDPCPPPSSTVKAGDINGDAVDDWLLAEVKQNKMTIQEWCVANADSRAGPGPFYLLVVNNFACGKCPFVSGTNPPWYTVILVNSDYHVRTQWVSRDITGEAITYVCDIYENQLDINESQIIVIHEINGQVVGTTILQPPPPADKPEQLPRG